MFCCFILTLFLLAPTKQIHMWRIQCRKPDADTLTVIRANNYRHAAEIGYKGTRGQGENLQHTHFAQD